MPEWSTEYQLVEVDADYLGKAVKPKQFIHIDRCPTGVIILGKVGAPDPDGDSHIRTNNHGYGYGMRL
jgi:hypothetical protein